MIEKKLFVAKTNLRKGKLKRLRKKLLKKLRVLLKKYEAFPRSQNSEMLQVSHLIRHYLAWYKFTSRVTFAKTQDKLELFIIEYLIVTLCWVSDFANFTKMAADYKIYDHLRIQHVRRQSDYKNCQFCKHFSLLKFSLDSIFRTLKSSEALSLILIPLRIIL